MSHLERISKHPELTSDTMSLKKVCPLDECFRFYSPENDYIKSIQKKRRKIIKKDINFTLKKFTVSGISLLDKSSLEADGFHDQINHRKVRHVHTEKLRRRNISSSIKTLTDLLPPFVKNQERKSSFIITLQHAIRYILVLKEENESLKEKLPLKNKHN